MKKRLLLNLIQTFLYIIGIVIFDYYRGIEFNFNKTLLSFAFFFTAVSVIYEIANWVKKQKEE